jgi:hypothetical protein
VRKRVIGAGPLSFFLVGDLLVRPLEARELIASQRSKPFSGLRTRTGKRVKDDKSVIEITERSALL